MGRVQGLQLSDVDDICEQMAQLVREKLRDLGRDGVVVGLSGGLDSTIASYVSVRAVGRDRVTLLYMPEKDSKPKHGDDAALVAAELGAELVVRDLTSVLSEVGVYDLLPIKYLPGRGFKEWVVKVGKSLGLGEEKDLLAGRLRASPGSLLAKGNAYACIKHRMRMVLLYQHAEIYNLMVVGAANRTELLTGTFVKWGCDQCADVMPLLHLYRSQLPQVAEYLRVPIEIRSKPADPDVMPGVDDKGKLLGSFALVDGILHLVEQGASREELIGEFGAEDVERVLTLVDRSVHMRESPYIVG